MKKKLRTVVIVSLLMFVGLCITGCGEKATNTATKTSAQNKVKVEQNLNIRIKTYDRMIQKNPSDYRIYIQRAQVKMQLNNYQGAYADIEQALIINPGDERAKSIKRQLDARLNKIR